MEMNTEEQLEQANVAAKKDLENPNYYGTCPDKDVTGDASLSARRLHLFTASAGSGKTWRLAFEYICLLLKDAYLPSEGKGFECEPDNYRHILAITFTNKATAEMKDRILANLELILNTGLTDEDEIKERNTYLAQLSARLAVPASVVVDRANIVYSNLLHDYSHFHIQTIDSFFQSVLRNLAQELGIGSYWEVELDSESVLKDAAHRLLNRVRDDDKLRTWVTDYVKDRLDDNKNWNIEGELVSFGSNLFSEALVTNDEMDNFLDDDPDNPTLRQRIRLIKQAVGEARNIALESIKADAARVVSFCDANGMPAEHFSRGTIYNYAVSLSNGIAKDDSATLVKFLEAGSADDMAKAAFTKAYQSQHLGEVVELQRLLKAAKATADAGNAHVTVFNQVLKNINQIGLLADIKKEVSDLQEEQNIFMLAYAQPLLHKFISNEDAPFVFERIGESLRYMMIDEFQDTSKVQYQNFRPLIQNCCAGNSGSLIVGDAKQAIYRFRNGDWKLIESLRKQSNGQVASAPELDMPTPIHGHDMQFNFRSAPNVVNFNNSVFRTDFSESSASFYPVPLSRSIVSLLSEANASHNEYLKEVYSTSHQFAKKNNGGYVKVKFHQTDDADKENDVPWTLKALLAEIKSLHGPDEQHKKVEYSDITILSRFNKDIPKIAAYLKANGVPVVSDLAFLLRASIRVRLIIDALRYVDAYVSKTSAHPKDELYKKQLSVDYLRYKHSSDASFGDYNGNVDELEHWCKILRGELGLNGEALVDDAKQKIYGIDVLPSLPVYDMVEEIYHLLFPTLPTDEYVQAFFDYLRDYLAHRVATVRDVLNYWDDKLSGISIPADPKKVNGVKMMSIHKSKGLEGQTVILANCSWKVTTDRQSSFWCSGINKLGDGMSDFEIPMLPIDFTSKLENTTFDNEYWEEMAQLHAENVNLFYVALTRAKNNLVVIDEYSIPKNEPADSSKFLNASMGRLFYEIFDGSDLKEDVVKVNDAQSDVCYELGEIVPSDCNLEPKKEEKEKKVIEPELVSECDTFSIRGRFRQSGEANSFIINKSIDSSADADFGIQMHSLLSYVRCFQNLDDLKPEIKAAVEKLQLEGVVGKQQGVDLANKALEYLEALKKKNPTCLKDWFAPELKVYNEDSIILYSEWTSKKLEEKRPDRMVYDEVSNSFTIVDYKTGHYSASLFAEHSKQVHQYMELARQLRPNATVSGYVWYLTANLVKTVE